jgi:hypothetical protein
MLLNIFKYSCFFVLLSSFCSTTAQDTTALKTKPEQILSFQTVSDIHFYSNHPVLLPVAKVSNFGLVEAQFNYLEGNLRRRQEPEFSSRINFSSLGIRAVKKYVVYGRFDYTREWQNGVGLAHRADINDPSPYYLFAKQPGNMDKITYSLSGDVTRKILKDKLLIGVGTDYLAGQNYRSVDPRPKIDVFQFKPRVSLAWYLSKQKLLGLTASYGYGKNVVTVAYKNDLFSETLIYPEYINYLNLGFGYSLQQQNTDGGKTLREDNQQKEIELVYATPFQKGDLTLLAGLKNNEQMYFRNTALTNAKNVIGTFYLDIPYFTMRYSLKKPLRKWLIDVGINQQNGQDFNNQLNGNNFISKETQANVLVGFTGFKNSNHNHELFLKSSFSTLEKADGVSANRMKVSNLATSLNLVKYWYFNSENIFRINLKAELYQNISNNLVVSPTFESYFVKEVVRPDFDYLKSNRLQYGIQAQYMRKKGNQQNFFVKSEINLQRLLNVSNSDSRTQFEVKSGFVF